MKNNTLKTMLTEVRRIGGNCNSVYFLLSRNFLFQGQSSIFNIVFLHCIFFAPSLVILGVNKLQTDIADQARAERYAKLFIVVVSDWQEFSLN